jgi:hypothetical protein
MSLQALKRKSAVLYRNLSVGSKNGGFSLNGTRRSQGYVGLTMLGRHFPGTPMRGNVARGNGGCCGTYKQGTIIQSVCFTSSGGNTANNNPKVVKSSVLNTKGVIMTKYRWIRRPQPYATVKPDSNMIQNTQQSYIDNLSKNTIAKLSTCNSIGKCKSYVNKCGGLTLNQRPKPFGTTIRIPRAWFSVTKDSDNTPALGPISQSAFIKALGGLCTSNDVLPKSKTAGCPLPGPPASY